MSPQDGELSRPRLSPALRVVVAEDEPMVATAIAGELRKLGHEVVGTADNGPDALRLCRSLRPDVALLDIYMPGSDGIAVARALNQEGEVPAILVTAFSSDRLASDADAAGVFGYLVKPVEARHLGPALRLARSRFLERRALAGASAAPRAVPATLRVSCFGWFRLWIGDRLVADAEYKRHSKDLLQLLLLTPGEPLSKASLMDQLFPEAEGDLANEYVNKAYSHLRRLLQEAMPDARPPSYVGRQGDAYALDPTTPLESDLDAFRRLVRQARLSAAAEEKARLYTLAAEYAVADLYVDQPNALWAERPRLEARAAAQRGLKFLVSYHRGRGERRLADEAMARLVALDPEREELWVQSAALAEAEQRPWVAWAWTERGRAAKALPPAEAKPGTDSPPVVR